MNGIYQHCHSAHLHRYLSEFDFRYNSRVALKVDDQQRADPLLDGVVGKRLTYQTTAGRSEGFKEKRMRESKNRPGPQRPKRLKLL
jgi:hypothetical protein